MNLAQATWEWMSPCFACRLSWWDLCPSADLHGLSQTAHQPTRPVCGIQLPSAESLHPQGPKGQNSLFAVLSQTASEPLPHPFMRTRCDHQPCTWCGLTTTLPLPPMFPLPFLGGRGEKPSPCTGHLQGSPALGGGMGTPESLLDWPDLGVCLGLLRGAERHLCAFFGTAHFSVRRRTSRSTMLRVLWCRQRRGPFTRPGLCTALYATACWPVCHYLYNGPHCAFAGLHKVPCVCACVYTGAKDTPGGPQHDSPRAQVPLVALCSGQPHLAHQGHRANKGHPLSLLLRSEISEEKALIWLPPSGCCF